MFNISNIFEKITKDFSIENNSNILRNYCDIPIVKGIDNKLLDLKEPYLWTNSNIEISCIDIKSYNTNLGYIKTKPKGKYIIARMELENRFEPRRYLLYFPIIIYSDSNAYVSDSTLTTEYNNNLYKDTFRSDIIRINELTYSRKKYKYYAVFDVPKDLDLNSIEIGTISNTKSEFINIWKPTIK